MLGLLVIVLGILAWIRFTGDNSMETRFYTEKIDQLGLVSGDVILPDGTIRMHNSPLDIGQSKDVFDQDIETLIRGRDANPFILNFEFARPQTVRGLIMDLGRMDFVVRVQVYGTDGGPISYEAEYREQPPIPHVDLDFSSGPDPVSRIYIEIEQLDPPDEVHVHVREVVFKK